MLVFEMVDSLEEIRAAVEAPDALLKKMLDAGGPVACKLVLAKLRPRLEPLLREKGMAWTDVLAGADQVDAAMLEKLKAQLLEQDRGGLQGMVGDLLQRLKAAKSDRKKAAKTAKKPVDAAPTKPAKKGASKSKGCTALCPRPGGDGLPCVARMALAIGPITNAGQQLAAASSGTMARIISATTARIERGTFTHDLPPRPL
jgi:hypothetical protein